jgi:hypothetical protein
MYYNVTLRHVYETIVTMEKYYIFHWMCECVSARASTCVCVRARVRARVCVHWLCRAFARV